MNKVVRIAIVALICAGAAPARQSVTPAILEAAAAGDHQTVARLLGSDPKLVTVTNADGETALHQAAGCRAGEEAGLPIVRLLLESGADVNAKNALGQTSLLYASYAGFGRVAKLLVDKGASCRYQDSNGRSPLHYAAREGRPALVELLLGKGADPSLKDDQGRTPLDYAVLRNQGTVLETLLRLVRYDPAGPEGSTLLHAAASQGHEEMVRSLLDKGADPRRPGPAGEPILLSYLRGGLGTLALVSIGDGADVNAKDAAGRTALHLAAEGGLDEVVKALLDKGADPDAADANGLTALAIAENWGSGAAAAHLTAKGARPVRPKAHLLKGGAYEIVEPPAGAKTETAVIRYIGTDGFLIQAGSNSVLVDGLVLNPWGYTNTPERALAMMKARKAPFERLDLLLFSHAHRDHFEPRMALDVLAAHAEATLVGDGLVERELRETGPGEAKALGPRIKVPAIGIGERTRLAVNGIPLTVLGVNHADRDPAYLTLGYIMDLGPFRIYHQGDLYPDANIAFLASIPWEEMSIDIAFFDPFFLQNEAGRKLVVERIRPSAVILMHMRDGESAGYFEQLKGAVPQVLYYRGPMESKRFVRASELSRRP